jgi:DNA-binding response OmpR family regulator
MEGGEVEMADARQTDLERWQPPRVVTLGAGPLPVGTREAIADDSVALECHQLDVVTRLPAPAAILVVPTAEDPPAPSVVRALRHRTNAPIVVITEGGTEHDRIGVLHAGADDCLDAGAGIGELLARIEAIGRRSSAAGSRQVGGVTIDHLTRDVWVGAEPIELTRREFDLLAFLVASPRQVFSREQLLSAVWGPYHQAADPATVTEHVRRLRAKLEAAGGSHECIRTLRGVGYRFEPERCTARCRWSDTTTSSAPVDAAVPVVDAAVPVVDAATPVGVPTGNGAPSVRAPAAPAVPGG